MRPRALDAGRRALASAVAALTLALLLAPVPPASARRDITHQVAVASDDLAQASKAVSRASAALEVARIQLPAAQAVLDAATARLAAAQRSAATATATEKRAVAAAAAAQRRLDDAKQRIVAMNLQIGALARAVYTQGPYTELAAILTASTPSDFADQLEAVSAVSRPQNRTLADLQAAKSELAFAGILAEQTRQKASDASRAAAAALGSASSETVRAQAARARVEAAADGKVLAVVNSGAYGLHTLISHGGGLSTMYAHQSRATVHVGQIVRQGQVIGYVGCSGWATGPHLHVEVHVGGVPYDPLGWFGAVRQPVPCWTG